LIDFKGSAYEIVSDVMEVTVIASGLVYLTYILITVLRKRVLGRN
jgi:hypothetical protein